jgi:hypothetical protein
MIAVVDNDILIKTACYSLLAALGNAAGGAVSDLGILGAARFVVEKRIGAVGLSGNVDMALAAFREFSKAAVILEPSDGEQSLAAELEYSAQQRGLALDVGESLLSAIVVTRAIPLMLTGDKRAIEAIEYLRGTHLQLEPIAGKVKCLEQLVRVMVQQVGVEQVRKKICAEHLDKALAYSFSCLQPSVEAQSVLEGLDSYIGDIRGQAPNVLAP